MNLDPALDGLLDLLAEATLQALESAAGRPPEKISARERLDDSQLEADQSKG